jgi:hypothetical protein
MKKNLDLRVIGLNELTTQESIKIEGGFLQYVPLAIAMGAICGWVFEKGEELGEALAQNH